MRESGFWKTIESSYFERLKKLIGQQIHRQNVGRGAEEEAGGSADGGGCGVMDDRCGTPGKDWKKGCGEELVEEMEPKCSTTYHHDATSLRQIELMEMETSLSGGTGGEALTAIEQDLEARRASARKKVRCRQHRLGCVLEMFQVEADIIIGQLESSYEGTEVDYTSSQRVMRLKGMLREAMEMAENLGSAKREAITVELIFSSCGLLRQLLSRLSQPLDRQPSEERTPLHPMPGMTFNSEGAVLVSEISGDGWDPILDATDQRHEIQQQEQVGCGSGDPPQRHRSIMDEETMKNDLALESATDDPATKESLPAPLTLSSSSASSSSVDSFCSDRLTSQTALFQPSFSFFRLPFLGACSHLVYSILSSLLFHLSSSQRTTSSGRRTQLRSALHLTILKLLQKFVDILKDFFRGKVKAEDTDDVKADAGNCSSSLEVELANRWIDWQEASSPQRMRLLVESVCEGKSWWLQATGWMPSASARLSIPPSFPEKVKGIGCPSPIPDDRSFGWMLPVCLLCLVVVSLSMIFFDHSPTDPIRMIGRMIIWILFDPVVDLRHRGLTPI